MASQDGIVKDITSRDERALGDTYSRVQATGERGSITMFTHEKPLRSVSIMPPQDEPFCGGHTGIIAYQSKDGRYLIQADGKEHAHMGDLAKKLLDASHQFIANKKLSVAETDLLIAMVDEVAARIPPKQAGAAIVPPSAGARSAESGLIRPDAGCKAR